MHIPRDGRPQPFGQKVDLLALRGPDSFIKKQIGHVNLAFARLAIVDPTSRSDQPFFGRDHEDFLLFNGQIYNHRQLKQEMMKVFGIKFKTESDTEVLYLGIKNFGKDFLRKVDGIFAFVYYNLQTRELLSARDEFGVKPLYFYEGRDHLIFSSELRPIIEITHAELDTRELAYFLATGTNYLQHSIYRGIKRLLPNQLIYSDERENLRAQAVYKDLSLANTETPSSNAITEKVETAIISQIPEQPFGLQLSGGIDSTVILSALKNESGLQQIYSVDVNHPKMSELEWQKEALRVLKSKHARQMCVIDAADLSLAGLRNVCVGQDLPYFHPNYIGADQMAERARSQGLKVLFSGEGADEMFGGYRWFQEAGSNLTPLFYNDYSSLCTIFGVEKYDLQDLHQMPKDEFFKKIYLQRWLIRSDLTGMKHGVEVRVPFLDRQLSAYMPKTPDLASQGSTLKQPLKLMLKRAGFTQRFLERKKMGFDFPLNEWVGVAHEKFAQNERDFFDGRLVAKVLQAPSLGHFRNRLVFTLCSFATWAHSTH